MRLASVEELGEGVKVLCAMQGVLLSDSTADTCDDRPPIIGSQATQQTELWGEAEVSRLWTQRRHNSVKVQVRCLYTLA